MPEIEKPLATFALFAYNQERFIEEAVEGALAQTYSPLEIIFSDDCSTDRTFEKIEDLVSKYEGPHKITLNRNTPNMGFAKHIDKVLNLVSSDLVVFAAGDDVSVSTRVEVIVDLWKRVGTPNCSIHSAYIPMDAYGCEGEPMVGISLTETSLRDRDARMTGGVNGCTHAFTKAIHQYFGPYDSAILCEDIIIPLRVRLLGKNIYYIEEPLVKYRMHAGTLARLPFDDHEIRKKKLVSWWEGQLAISRQFAIDAEMTREENLIDPDDREWLMTLVREDSQKAGWQLRMLTLGIGGRFATVVKSLGRVSPQQSAKWLILTVLPYVLVSKLRTFFLGRKYPLTW